MCSVINITLAYETNLTVPLDPSRAVVEYVEPKDALHNFV